MSIRQELALALRSCRLHGQIMNDREDYAKHRSMEGQQEFRWITIGGDHDANTGARHSGGTPVMIKGSTGEIVGGPASLTGRKLSELDKDVAGTNRDRRKENDPPEPKTSDTYPKSDAKLISLDVKQMGNGRWYAMADLPDGSQVTRSGEDREKAVELATKDVERAGFSLSDTDDNHSPDQESTDSLQHLDPSGKQVEFKAFGDRQLQWIDTQALQDAWKSENPGNYVERGGANELDNRIDDFGNWYQQHAGQKPIEASHVQIDDHGHVAFNDGRHRFNWFAEQGWDKVPVQASAEDAEALQSRFGGSRDTSNMSEADSRQAVTEGKVTQSQLFNDALLDGSDPRAAADRAQQAADQSEYEFARSSSIGNAGEDLKGSARHRVNEWRSLEDAEADGTAEAMVNRKELLKYEPVDLIDKALKKPLSALAMHLTMSKFPNKPGPSSARQAARLTEEDKRKDRKQYLDAYRRVKAKAEEIAENITDPRMSMKAMSSFLGDLIREFRQQDGSGYGARHSAKDPYNNTANRLVDLHKSLSSPRLKTGVYQQVDSFSKAMSDHPAGVLTTENIHKAAESVQSIIEGTESMSQIAGGSGKSEKKRYFKPSDLYVNYAKREGGQDVSSITKDPNQATQHMVDHFGMRGIQWGNSVTDDERRHHSERVVEAFTDLVDILGIRPEDAALKGALGLAIGARGKGSALAHYEPGNKVINLTRKGGVGALAHEWGHGFDHMIGGGDISSDGTRSSGNYFSTQTSPRRFKKDSHGGVVTEVDENGLKKAVYEDRSEDPMFQAYKNLRDVMQSSGFNQRLSSEISEQIRKGYMAKGKQKYWTSNEEKFARCFERYCQHKLSEQGRKNTYLTGLSGGPGYELWPNDDEVKAMAPAFEGILDAYRKREGITENYSREQIRQALTGMLEVEFKVRYGRGLFDEEQHPRAADGKFTAGSQSAKKPAGIPGQQMGLFNETPSGQMQLFNVVPAKSNKGKRKSSGRLSDDDLNSITAGLDAKLKNHIRSKKTVSPADRGSIVQEESLDGQKELFQRSIYPYKRGDDAGRWITLKPNDNGKGVPVHINSQGKITAGPKALTGRSLKTLGQQSVKTKRTNSLRDAARRHGLDQNELSETVDSLWPEIRKRHEEREELKLRARRLTGLTERDIARTENNYQDHSTVANFDTTADELAMEYPHLFGNDPSAELWEMLREGKQQVPPKHSDEVIQEAVDYLQANPSKPSVPLFDLPDSTEVDGEIIPFSRTRYPYAVWR